MQIPHVLFICSCLKWDGDILKFTKYLNIHEYKNIWRAVFRCQMSKYLFTHDYSQYEGSKWVLGKYIFKFHRSKEFSGTKIKFPGWKFSPHWTFIQSWSQDFWNWKLDSSMRSTIIKLQSWLHSRVLTRRWI